MAYYGVTKKSNPDTAAEAYTEFHGRAPHEILEGTERHIKAGDYFALGEMRGLWLRPVKGDPSNWGEDLSFTKADGVKLACDPQGAQLYFIGGNQDLPDSELTAQGYPVSERWVELGTCYAIDYRTEKSFDRFRSHDYAHEFGEETGERPTAWYDREARKIVLVGGAYKIAPLDANLGASPGIVN